MSIIITGGTGFVGLALAEALQASGREVVLFGRDPMPDAFTGILGRLPFRRGDITDGAALEALLAATAPEAVVHLAAVTPDRAAEMDDPSSVVAVNIGGTTNLMRAMSRLKRRPKVLLASSVAVYGETPPPGATYREDEAVPAPQSLYGITKLAAEDTARRLAGLYDIDLTIVRLGPVYGPWEYRTGLRPLLSPHAQVVDLWQRGEHVVLPRRLTGDWLYSRDAGRGLADLLLASHLPNGLYNLGGGSMTDVADWSEHLETAPWAHEWRIAGETENPNVIFGLAKDRAALDIARIARDVGFRPRFSGRTAADDYLSWLAAVDVPL
ncbi:NAD-dependent epimerase/dehydratase family protein [Rhizobium binxianense]